MPMQLPTRRYGGDSEESVDEGASGVDRNGPLASLILRGRPEGYGPLRRPSAIPFCKPITQTPHAHHLLLSKLAALQLHGWRNMRAHVTHHTSWFPLLSALVSVVDPFTKIE